MSDWSRAAREYLNGYLQQVTALALERGDEAQEIVDQLRDHVERELEQQGAALITVEHLRLILSGLGTPEEVIGVDRATLAARLTPPHVPSASTTPAGGEQGRLYHTPPPQRIVIEKRSGPVANSCLFIVLSLVLIFILVPAGCIVWSITVPALSRSRETAQRAACQGNLKQVAMILQQYYDKHGSYPPLSTVPGNLMFDAAAFVPPVQNPTSVLQCPSNQRREEQSAWQDDSYIYLPYLLRDPRDFAAFRERYEDMVKQGPPPAGITLNAGGAEVVLRPLTPAGFPSEGLAPAQLPIVIERPRTHIPDGANVLYLDGHVEFVRLGSKFPVIPDFFAQLNPVDTIDGDPEFTAKPGETSGWAPVVP